MGRYRSVYRAAIDSARQNVADARRVRSQCGLRENRGLVAFYLQQAKAWRDCAKYWTKQGATDHDQL